MPHAAQKPCEWMSRCHSQGRPFQPPATGMAAGRALCSLASCARSVWAPHCNNQIAASLLTFPQGKERNKCGCHQEIVSSHLLGNELNLCWLPHVPFLISGACSWSDCSVWLLFFCLFRMGTTMLWKCLFLSFI